MTHVFQTLRTFGQTLFRKEDGASSVEFALILPVMLSIYFGVVELSNALIADRKLNKTGSAVADLVAQAILIDNNQMDDIFDASTTIMEPFGATTLTVVVASVVADENNVTTIDWSDALNGTAYAPGSPYTLPPGLTTAGSSVIVAEATYTYTSPIGQYLTGGITFSNQYFLRPRRTSAVGRTS